MDATLCECTERELYIDLKHEAQVLYYNMIAV